MAREVKVERKEKVAKIEERCDLTKRKYFIFQDGTMVTGFGLHLGWKTMPRMKPMTRLFHSAQNQRHHQPKDGKEVMARKERVGKGGLVVAAAKEEKVGSATWKVSKRRTFDNNPNLPYSCPASSAAKVARYR